MSMAWERTHRRYELTQAIADLERQLDREHPAYRLPLDAHPAPTAADDHHRAALRAVTGADQPAHDRTRRVS